MSRDSSPDSAKMISSPLIKTRSSRPHKPNSRFFTDEMEIEALRRTRRPKSLSNDIKKDMDSKLSSSTSKKDRKYSKRRGRPPKILSENMSEKEANPQTSPILNSLLNTSSSSVNMSFSANPKGGRPKGRPRKYSLPVKNVYSKKVSHKLKDLIPILPGSNGTCDCSTKYMQILTNLQENLESKHRIQLQKVGFYFYFFRK